jgi:putative hemolysin
MRKAGLIFLAAGLALVACTPVGGGPTQQPAGLPNPASEYCEGQGYTLEMRGGYGGQTGYCIFPDDSECEEWAFLRGECGQEYSYCAGQGYSLEARTSEEGDAQMKFAVCVFPDGSECEELAYFKGECTYQP